MKICYGGKYMYTASTMLAKASHNSFIRKKNSNFYRNVYLNSDHWKLLREEKLATSYTCEKCGSKSNLNVHHKEYKELYDVKISDLQTLCRKCHDKEHLKRKNNNHKFSIDKRVKRENKLRNRYLQQHERDIKALRKTYRNKKLNLYLIRKFLNSKEPRKLPDNVKRRPVRVDLNPINTYISIHY
jgi:hypothetical protein